MADKSLGQHWLFDRSALESIADSADVQDGDKVLEIGPGLGTLTRVLLSRGAKVIAVEVDDKLSDDLEVMFSGQNFKLYREDIRTFDLSKLPKGYKAVANIPYYLTSQLLRSLCESPNHPSKAALLVQKEVAERAAASEGRHSILSICTQVYANVSKGILVPSELFSPPPKVDSQVLCLDFYPKSLVHDERSFFHVVKAGFSQPRKKLRNSLSGGLGISVQDSEALIATSGIDPGVRAEALSISQWLAISDAYREKAYI